MKDKKILSKRIPTILGILVLLAGLIGGVLMVGEPKNLITKAGPTSLPRDVKITNRDYDSLTISWITDVPVTGFVNYSSNPADLSLSARDDRDQSSGEAGLYTTHYVNLTGLTANQSYYFSVGSGSQVYDNNGTPYQTKTTTRTVANADDLISGKILAVSGEGVDGAIVYVELEGAEQLSAITKPGGSWQLDLKKAKDKTGNGLNYDANTQRMTIFVQAGSAGTATAITNTGNDTPVGSITLGSNTNMVGVGSGDLKSGSQVTSNTGGGFSELGGTSEEISNPQIDGERIATSTPEFRGKLPAGTSLTIRVQSEEQTATVIVGDDGIWTWTPPVELEPGNHTITLEYNDSQGILQTISRSFVVLAAVEAGGVPAFVATPSATPTTTVTPTSTGSSETRTSMPATESGIPEAGVLTPTLWLFIVGLGMFIGGQLIKRRMAA